MNPSRRNTVAPDTITNIIFSYGIGHSKYGPFGDRISKPIGNRNGRSHGSHVQYNATTFFHMWDNSKNTVIGTFYVYAIYSIEVFLWRVFNSAHMGYPSIIYQNIYGVLFCNACYCTFYILLNRDVALVDYGTASFIFNFQFGFLSIFKV